MRTGGAVTITAALAVLAPAGQAQEPASPCRAHVDPTPAKRAWFTLGLLPLC